MRVGGESKMHAENASAGSPPYSAVDGVVRIAMRAARAKSVDVGIK
jgi:hypothetical protein